jgi:hypothetical protein
MTGATFGWRGELTELATEDFEILLIYPYGEVVFSLRRDLFKRISAHPGLCLDPAGTRGCSFYWLRNNHRILYGTREILAALALMYFIYFPHGGPVLLTGGYIAPSWLDVISSESVGFFPSVYGFVRGCDNIITELRA